MNNSVVYVGIPAEGKPREQEEGEKKSPITNAQIGYIQEFGDEARGIPPRPVLIPGVKDAEAKMLEILQAGSAKALEGKSTINKVLSLIGVIAVSSVKNRITTSTDLKPLSTTTIAIRKLKSRKGNTKFSGERPLLDTGQYRNAFTYVVDVIRGKK
jgi:hypothetical protein